MVLTKFFGFIKMHIKMAITIAICFSSLYIGGCAYFNYYSYSINFSLVYPGIEKGQYPNGERFMMYDFIDTKRIQEALDVMQGKGLYTGITPSDLSKYLNVNAYLLDPVSDRVNYDRKAGEDFSYYSNEYVLTFKQPNIFNLAEFGLFPKNHAKDFLNELVNVNLQYIMNTYSDNKMGYFNLSKSSSNLQNDYSDIVDYYNRSISACVAFLYEKEAEGKAYTLSNTGQSFKKLIVSYQNLMDTDAAKLSSFVKSNRLTNQIWQYENRSKVTLERLSQSIQKSSDESAIAKDAMSIYDHTFTEHIVIVAQNEEDGLYQAHPKTGYDTITQQTLTASVKAAEGRENYNKLSNETVECANAYINNSEYSNLLLAADKMVSNVKQRYDELNDITIKTLDEYLHTVNGDYMRTTTKQSFVISFKVIARAAGLFILIMFVVFGICFINDKSSKKKKKTRPFRGISI